MTTPDPKTGPELLPCPFCGGEAEMEQGRRDFSWAVYCAISIHSGGCFGRMDGYVEKSDAISAWNTRSLPAFDAVVKALEKMMDPETIHQIEAGSSSTSVRCSILKEARAALALADKVRGKS